MEKQLPPEWTPGAPAPWLAPLFVAGRPLPKAHADTTSGTRRPRQGRRSPRATSETGPGSQETPLGHRLQNDPQVLPFDTRVQPTVHRATCRRAARSPWFSEPQDGCVDDKSWPRRPRGAQSSEHCSQEATDETTWGMGGTPARPCTELGFLGASLNRAAPARVQGRVASSVPNAVLLHCGLALLSPRGAEEGRRVASAGTAQPNDGTRFSFKVNAPLPPSSNVPFPLGRQIPDSGRSA